MPGIAIQVMMVLVVVGLLSLIILDRSSRSRREHEEREERKEDSDRRFPIKTILWTAALLPVLGGLGYLIYHDPIAFLESGMVLNVVLLALFIAFMVFGGPGPTGKLSIVRTIGQAIRLYRENFLKLVVMSSLVSLPLLLLFVTLRIPRQFNYLITMQPLVMALVAVAVTDRLSSEPISVFRAYRCVFRRVTSLTLGMVATSALLALTRWDGSTGWTFILFVVWLAFVPHQVLLRRQSGWRALIESRRLERGHGIKVAVLLIIIHLGFPLTCSAGGLAVRLARRISGAEFYAVSTFLRELAFDENSLLRQIVNIVLVPFFGAIMAVCYYGLRSQGNPNHLEEIAKETRACLDRKVSRTKVALNGGIVAFLAVSFLCLTIVPVGFSAPSLPFYLGLWRRETYLERSFVSEVPRNVESVSGVGVRKEVFEPNQTPPWILQYAYHRGISQPGVPSDDGMVLIAAGDFVMGAARGEGEPDEEPEHTVYLDDYLIDRHEVTNAEYKNFLDATGHPAPRDWWRWPWGTEVHYPPGKGTHPVVNVTWEDASAFAQWAGKRLPTEAEWEKAARGTDGLLFPWGASFSRDIRGERVHANIRSRFFTHWLGNTLVSRKRWNGVANTRVAHAINDGFTRTAPVGTFPSGASPYGVMDMAGNALEWTADWYDRGSYLSSPGWNPKGPDHGEKRVLRGGSWRGIPYSVRCAVRYYASPDHANEHTGFRCAKDP